jgi:hypothetical protein
MILAIPKSLILRVYSTSVLSALWIGTSFSAWNSVRRCHRNFRSASWRAWLQDVHFHSCRQCLFNLIRTGPSLVDTRAHCYVQKIGRYVCENKHWSLVQHSVWRTQISFVADVGHFCGGSSCQAQWTVLVLKQLGCKICCESRLDAISPMYRWPTCNYTNLSVWCRISY